MTSRMVKPPPPLTYVSSAKFCLCGRPLERVTIKRNYRNTETGQFDSDEWLRCPKFARSWIPFSKAHTCVGYDHLGNMEMM